MNVTAKMIKKAEVDLQNEQRKQALMVYPAMFCVLWEDYNWRSVRIMRRFIAAVDAMKEGVKNGTSVLETLEEETGIEMALDGEKSYHEFAYLSADTKIKPINNIQYVYMLKQEKKWIPSLLIAGVCIILHRQDKWGFDRLSNFVTKVNILRNLLGEDQQQYSNYMFECTGHRPEEMWKEYN